MQRKGKIEMRINCDNFERHGSPLALDGKIVAVAAEKSCAVDGGDKSATKLSGTSTAMNEALQTAEGLTSWAAHAVRRALEDGGGAEGRRTAEQHRLDMAMHSIPKEDRRASAPSTAAGSMRSIDSCGVEVHATSHGISDDTDTGSSDCADESDDAHVPSSSESMLSDEEEVGAELR